MIPIIIPMAGGSLEGSSWQEIVMTTTIILFIFAYGIQLVFSIMRVFDAEMIGFSAYKNLKEFLYWSCIPIVPMIIVLINKIRMIGKENN